MKRKGTSRKNKNAQGAHSYKVGPYDVTLMADGCWYLFLDGEDTGRDYGTLREARKAITEEGKTDEVKTFTEMTDGELAEELCRSLIEDPPFNIFAAEYRSQIRAEIRRRGKETEAHGQQGQQTT